MPSKYCLTYNIYSKMKGKKMEKIKTPKKYWKNI